MLKSRIIFKTHLSFPEEKKKLIRDFDEKQQEANETVRTGTSPIFLSVGLCQK